MIKVLLLAACHKRTFAEIKLIKLSSNQWTLQPALVAQLDARATGDQEVAGLTPACSATFFCGD